MIIPIAVIGKNMMGRKMIISSENLPFWTNMSTLKCFKPKIYSIQFSILSCLMSAEKYESCGMVVQRMRKIGGHYRIMIE